MCGCEPAVGQLTHLNNHIRYYRDNKSKILLAELHKLWKHYATYLKDNCFRKDDSTPCKSTNNTKFEIGQAVVIKYHVSCFQT